MKFSKATITRLFSITLSLALLTPFPEAGAVDKAPPETKAKPNDGLVTKELKSIFRNWLANPTLKHSNCGLELMDVESGDVLYSFNGRRRYTPASTAKAITCACAYEILKPNSNYTTTLSAEGSVSKGVLHGNLVLVPSQDPTLMRANLVKLVQEARKKEVKPGERIKEITGHVLIRNSPVTSGGFHPSWLVEDWGRHWMPVASNLVVDRNITHTTGLIPNTKHVKAASMHGDLFKRLLRAKGGPGWVYLDPRRNVQYIYHSSHPQTPKSVTLTISNPDVYNRALLEAIVKQNGIKVGNKNVKLSNNDSVYQLASHNSTSLSNIIRRTLHKSDNLYAQQLLRTIGVHYLRTRKSTSKIPENACLEDYGVIGIQKWLQHVGVSGHEVILYDGCGLCRKNGISPHALNQVMRYMAKGEKTAGYIDLLKANDETDRGRGSYKYKTGTMDSIRSISGILTTAGKQKLALTIMANGHTPSIRGLRIAMSGLINQLRVIKYIGEKIPEIRAGADGDANLTTATEAKVLVDTKALHPPKPKKKIRKKRRRRRGRR